MPLNDKQKTYLRIGIIGVVLLYIAPRVIAMYELHQAMQRAAFASAHPKPSPAVPLAPKNTAQPAGLTLPIAMGRYAGGGISNTRQCQIGLEMRPVQADTYAGYATMVCVEPAHFKPGIPVTKQNPILDAVRQKTPASAIMSGTLRNGELVFNVDKSIGTFGDGCPLTGTFTVSPFGSAQILIQWQEGKCEGGQLIMNRIGG